MLWVTSFWLDADNDGVFSASELLGMESNNNGTFTISTYIIIPQNLTGNLRLRIRSEYIDYGNPYDPCNYVTYGEAEDYTLFLSPAPCPATVSSSNLALSAVQTSGGTSLSWDPGKWHQPFISSKGGQRHRPPGNYQRGPLCCKQYLWQRHAAGWWLCGIQRSGKCHANKWTQ